MLGSVIRHFHEHEKGQVLALFAFGLAAFLGLVGMSIDVGNFLYQRTDVQKAADAAALAAAQDIGTTEAAIDASGHAYATANGGTSNVVVNHPPVSGSRAGDLEAVEVIVTRPVNKYFIGVLYTGPWQVSARSVAVRSQNKTVGDSFIALRSDCAKHTLKVDLGGLLTVKGSIYVNSGNANFAPCNNFDKPPWTGDGFDVFGAGGTIAAAAIYVHGGWETHNGDIVTPDPLINQPIVLDPLASVSPPSLTAYTVRHGTSAAPSALTISSGVASLQPGVYYGGIAISGTAKVTLAAGVYIMAGGGLSVTNSAWLTGSGVMIYNTRASASGSYTAVNLATTGTITLSAPGAGTYAGLLIFQDRAATTNVILRPGNGISGLSGTVYAPGWNASSKADPKCPGTTANAGAASVIVGASGVANLQVIAAQILICGANATFNFDSHGLAANGGLLVSVSLAE